MTALLQWRRWLDDRRAATAIMFGLTAMVIFGFVALAVDVGGVVRARSRLELAADAAALTAATKAANDFAANSQTSLIPARDAGVKRFNAQAGQLPGVTIGPLSVNVTNSGGKMNAVVVYTAKFKTHFAGLFGFPNFNTSATISASRRNTPFIAINILMDDSSSMAIAATPADMLRLGALVGALATGSKSQKTMYTDWAQNQNCAFGCHFSATNNDFYGLAKLNNVSLRIDVLTTAVTNVIGTIAASPAAPQFTVGLYSFNSTFQTVYAPSTNLTAAGVAARAMTVPVTTDGGAAGTNIPLALQSITTLMPASGDGSSAASPLRFLFIATDGVADYFNAQGVRVLAALNPAQCSALKAKGVQIMTLYTQYFPVEPPNVKTANAYYVSNVKPFVGSIAPNMTACASSPSYAFQANDGVSIGVALNAMLVAATSTPARFTK